MELTLDGERGSTHGRDRGDVDAAAINSRPTRVTAAVLCAAQSGKLQSSLIRTGGPDHGWVDNSEPASRGEDRSSALPRGCDGHWCVNVGGEVYEAGEFERATGEVGRLVRECQ